MLIEKSLGKESTHPQVSACGQPLQCSLRHRGAAHTGGENSTKPAPLHPDKPQWPLPPRQPPLQQPRCSLSRSLPLLPWEKNSTSKWVILKIGMPHFNGSPLTSHITMLLYFPWAESQVNTHSHAMVIRSSSKIWLTLLNSAVNVKLRW